MSMDGTKNAQVARLQRHLRFYRNLTMLLGLIVVVLAATLILGRGQRFARAIRIDKDLICFVKDEKIAERVHERILSEAKGDLPGEAALEEQWEDASWPVDDNEVFSIDQALEALRPRVNVVVEVAIIEVDGARGVVMPSESLAKDVLEALKASYVGKDDTIVEQQVFLEDVKISCGQARVPDIVTEIGQAVKRLGKTKREAQTYKVKAGEFAEKIAGDHGMTVPQLWELNPDLRGTTIHPGDVVKVSTPTAGITVKTIKEITREIELEIEVLRVKSDSVPKGETLVATEGTPPIKLQRVWQTYHNDKMVEEEIQSGQIIEPGTARKVLVGTREKPAAGAGSSN